MSGEKPNPTEQGEVAREAVALANSWRDRLAGIKYAQNSSTALTHPSLELPHGPLALPENHPYRELLLRGIKFTTPNSPKR